MGGADTLAILASAACFAILLGSYRSLRSPFFLYMAMAGFSLACAAAASYFMEPAAEALLDLAVASFGAVLAAAARLLLLAFRLAGENHD